MRSWSWLAVILLAFGPVVPIWGDDPAGPVVTASADFNSAYIWRGRHRRHLLAPIVGQLRWAALAHSTRLRGEWLTADS